VLKEGLQSNYSSHPAGQCAAFLATAYCSTRRHHHIGKAPISLSCRHQQLMLAAKVFMQAVGNDSKSLMPV
jgi:hypothetical protein